MIENIARNGGLPCQCYSPRYPVCAHQHSTGLNCIAIQEWGWLVKPTLQQGHVCTTLDTPLHMILGICQLCMTPAERCLQKTVRRAGVGEVGGGEVVVMVVNGGGDGGGGSGRTLIWGGQVAQLWFKNYFPWFLWNNITYIWLLCIF